MTRKQKATKLRQTPKAVLRLPDLDQAKSAVLNSLSSADAQRGYRHAICCGMARWAYRDGERRRENHLLALFQPSSDR
jgi:hypothetical protein